MPDMTAPTDLAGLKDDLRHWGEYNERLRYVRTAELLSKALAAIEALEARLAVPAGDDLRMAVSRAIDSLPGKLHSEKIDAVLAAVVPVIREECIQAVSARLRPRNPTHDWTEYAARNNECADWAVEAIRALGEAGGG